MITVRIPQPAERAISKRKQEEIANTRYLFKHELVPVPNGFGGYLLKSVSAGQHKKQEQAKGRNRNGRDYASKKKLKELCA